MEDMTGATVCQGATPKEPSHDVGELMDALEASRTLISKRRLGRQVTGGAELVYMERPVGAIGPVPRAG